MKMLKTTYHLTKLAVVAALAIGYCFAFGRMLGGA